MNEFDARWRILCEARTRAERSADANFVYAVLTTGVFCLPGCKSRLPLRGNVRFFESTLAAKQAGYRACKRCHPERARSPEDEILERTCRSIEESESPPSLEALARAANLSSSRLHRLFKAKLGITPKRYASAVKRGELQRSLEAGHSVTRAIHGARYASASRVYEKSSELLGMTPKAFATGGAGLTIRSGVARCSLGHVLVAATNQGVCAVELGPNEPELVRRVKRRFLRAEHRALDPSTRRWLQAVVREIDGHPANGVASLPMDVRGTAFQERVWSTLKAIPRGETTTYSELARRLGNAKASRAVANACAANPLAVLVPCHRVLRKDGNLGGYRWGLDRKRALLAKERSPGHYPQGSVAKARP